MIQNQYSGLFLDQSKDLIWAVDHHFCLVYANKAYLNLMKEVTGREKKLNKPVLIEGFGDGYIEKWKAYYERGLNGEYFEIEEHFYNPNTNEAEYSLITFNPIADENDVIVNVACQSRDITSFKKSNTEAEKLLDASLDVICQMDEHGIFTKVSAACKELWGYEKHELVGKPYIDFVIQEDTEKTNQVASDIIDGKAITTFENRYKRKDGSIAFNLWSARYDPKTQIMFCVARDAREKIRKAELLVESENRFKSLVQEGSDLIGILDEAGIYTYVSPTSIGILGMDPDEFIGKSPFDYIHPEDAEKTLNSLGKITTESRLEVAPFRFKNKNGEWRWIETVLTNMLDNPAIRGIVTNSRDITQRKKADAEIAKSEEKRMLIMNGALDAIISIDTNETITFWNAQAEVIFGWKAEEVMGKPLSEMIIPEPFRKYHIEGIKNYLQTGEGKALNVLLELSAIRRNREEFPIELTVIPIKQGGEEFFCAFIRDITQRKKAEREIKQANERFEKATEATNDVIWDWDIESGTLFRSNAIDNFFGLETSKVLDKQDFWNDNFHDEDLPKIKSSIQKALDDPDCNRWEEEYRIFNNNNEIIFVIDRGLILRNKNGKAIRMVGAITNITDQKKQKEKLIELNQSLIEQASELKRSNEELEQFAFITSHDLQEPLRMISSFMDQLKRKYADRLDEKGLKYIHFATDGAKRMKQIILDLLLYSRANKPIEQNELINLNEIVSEYTQMRRKVISEKSATITFHELPSIETYRAPITQIFHCLLDNALKYVDENKPPSIKISAIEKENVWEFAIKDNGIGIEQKFFNKIFIIFQRLQNRKENDGNGIGLSVAKRSVEFLGGEIWVESEIDKGSTFYFTIFKIKQLV